MANSLSSREKLVADETKGRVKGGTPLLLELDFEGVAAYAAYLCTPNPAVADKWKVAHALTQDGKSTDAQLDKFQFSGLAAGARMMVFVSAELTSPDPKGKVELRGVVTKVGSSEVVARETREFQLQNGGKVQLDLRIYVEGE